MMRRRRSGAFPLIILAIALGLAAAACGSMPQVNHSLTYSLVPYKGGLTAKVADGRAGKHTVWVVLLNPPKGVPRELLGSESTNSGAGMGSGSTHGPLPAGTYKYAVYSADGNVHSAMAQYWTPKYLVAKGRVTVP
jgi:hypothetical protein